VREHGSPVPGLLLTLGGVLTLTLSGLVLLLCAVGYLAMDSAYLRGNWGPALMLYAAGLGLALSLEGCAVLPIVQGRGESRAANNPANDRSRDVMEPQQAAAGAGSYNRADAQERCSCATRWTHTKRGTSRHYSRSRSLAETRSSRARAGRPAHGGLFALRLAHGRWLESGGSGARQCVQVAPVRRRGPRHRHCDKDPER
jgi:hypothetical protein